MAAWGDTKTSDHLYLDTEPHHGKKTFLTEQTELSSWFPGKYLEDDGIMDSPHLKWIESGKKCKGTNSVSGFL
jgi:hypothetical protein